MIIVDNISGQKVTMDTWGHVKILNPKSKSHRFNGPDWSESGVGGERVEVDLHCINT